MKSDIEIAQEAMMQPIKEVAASYGIRRTTWSCMVSIKPN